MSEAEYRTYKDYVAAYFPNRTKGDAKEDHDDVRSAGLESCADQDFQRTRIQQMVVAVLNRKAEQ